VGVDAASVIFGESDEQVGLLGMESASDGLKRVGDGRRAVDVERDGGFDELADGGPGVTGRLEDCGGNTAKAVQAQLKSFAWTGGSPAFARSAHRHGLDAGSPDDHDIDWAGMVVEVGENEVSPFGVAVVRGDELFTVDRSTPPYVEDFMKGVGYGLMSPHSPGAICTRDGVVAKGVATPRAWGAVRGSVRAWSCLQDLVPQAEAERHLEDGVRHEVRG
jgi:hypothetical protein